MRLVIDCSRFQQEFAIRLTDIERFAIGRVAWEIDADARLQFCSDIPARLVANERFFPHTICGS